MTRKIVGLVLAAGRSERAQFPKALGLLRGETLVARALRTFRDAGVEDVMVVVAEPHADRVREAIGGVDSVTNPVPERGMLSSLAAGMRAALARAPSHVVFALVDHPHVRAQTVRRLLEVVGDADGARPMHAGRTGHPVVVSARVAQALANAELSLTARDVLTLFRIVDVEVDDPAVCEDLDSAAELASAEVEPR